LPHDFLKMVLEEDESFQEIFPEEEITPGEFKVIFAIIYSEDKTVEERLLISKLNMVHGNRELEKLGFNVEKLRIKDASG